MENLFGKLIRQLVSEWPEGAPVGNTGAVYTLSLRADGSFFIRKYETWIDAQTKVPFDHEPSESEGWTWITWPELGGKWFHFQHVRKAKYRAAAGEHMVETLERMLEQQGKRVI